MIHSFLLIGQSNMAGRGFIHDAIDVDTSHIKVLRNGRWQGMFRPINPDRAFSGVSLAERFAERYYEEFKTDVGLICCADGGTTLKQWKKGSLLFDNACFNAKLAQRTSVIRAILWHQGESNCSLGSSDEYGDNLKQIIKDFREELNLRDIPFLIGGLGDYLPNCQSDPNLKNYDCFNIIMQTVASELPNIGFVSAKGLTSNPDYLHFNSKSLYEFGERYFDVFNSMCDKIDPTKYACVEDDEKRSAMELL